MAQIHYEQRFRQRLEEIHPQADLGRIHLLPADAGLALLREILETGCLSGNFSNIQLARQALAQIPADWLLKALPKAVPQCLFQQPEWREWEFRRLAEMLKVPFPACLTWLLAYAKGLEDPEVEEAVLDFAESP